MEPIHGHVPGGVMYDHESRQIEYPAPLGHGHAPEHLSFSLSPVGYYPSPVLYSVPYGSPVPSWGSYMEVSSPMGRLSEHVSLSGEDPPVFADVHGYHPYLPA